MPENRNRTGPLHRTGVVVTRPAAQADGLVSALERAGATAYRFPVLAIEPPTDERLAQRLFKRLPAFDLAVFISANAAQRGMAMIQAAGGLPKGLQVAAVGEATARALRALGVKVDLVPEGRFDSQALLALESFQAPVMAGRHVLIVRGEGGRAVLGETLRARGASVEYAEVYRRVRPDTPPQALLDPLAKGGVDIIVVTSGEGLRNLWEMVGEAGRQWLVHTPLLVIGERVAELARSTGWRVAPVVAAEASDAALVEALVQWRCGRVRPARGLP